MTAIIAQIDQASLAGLRAAVARNPAKVLSEVSNFLARGIRAYNETIIRSPWRVGASGGGAPVDTGNLRDTHMKSVSTWEARIYPTAPYAESVHEGHAGVRARPWLDYAQRVNEARIAALQNNLLDNIVKDLVL
jgi:hypothetical protein